MHPAVRIALFSATLLVVFGLAFALGALLIPESLLEAWSQQTPH